jgi:spectinomycin phosphotransferase
MIEKPKIRDERIQAALQQAYGITAGSLEFLPLGWDVTAWSYRAESDGAAYFLKIRTGITNPAGISIPYFLAGQAVPQVIAPLPSVHARIWEKVDDLYFSLYPFITGRPVVDTGMSEAHWVEFGALLRRLHSCALPRELAATIRRETFTPKMLTYTRELHARMPALTPRDPLQEELATFWLGQHDTIRMVIERMQALAGRLQNSALEFVPCHADAHTANLLLSTDDRLYLVDWDEAMLAPKERDLMFILGDIFGDPTGGRAAAWFFQGYGDAQVAAPALAYYRYDWCIEDMGGFAEQVFDDPQAGEATRREAVRFFKSLFLPGRSIPTALATQIEPPASDPQVES